MNKVYLTSQFNRIPFSPTYRLPKLGCFIMVKAIVHNDYLIIENIQWGNLIKKQVNILIWIKNNLWLKSILRRLLTIGNFSLYCILFKLFPLFISIQVICFIINITTQPKVGCFTLIFSQNFVLQMNFAGQFFQGFVDRFGSIWTFSLTKVPYLSYNFTKTYP